MTGFRSARCFAFAILAGASIPSTGTPGPAKADATRAESREATVTVGSARVKATLVNPASRTAPRFVVVFASGDGGLRGVSKTILKHLADRGYWVIAFSSPEAFENAIEQSGKRPNYFASRDAFASIVTQGKSGLGLPDPTPVIVTGMSRGANVVVASAGDPVLKSGIIGAVAIALTREFDDLTVPDAAKRLPGVEMDDKGRIQTYSAIARLGSIPLAIIQSTNDSYVRSTESRRLLGPDTQTRRLYEVESRNHSFGGGQEALMRDLDDAMDWIVRVAGIGADTR